MTQEAPPLARSRTRWSSASVDDQFIVENPATGQPVTLVQGAGPDEVDQAVRAAHAAQPNWRRRPARERGRYLRQIAELLRAHADEIAELESLEMGKPITQARNFDVEAAIGIFEYFGSLVEMLPSQARDYGPVLDVTTLEPYGVIAGIVPFNWPPIHTAGKIAPALAVGNAIVLKPPEQAPSVVLRMVELIQSVLPDRVVHVVPGKGPVGARLAGHRLVGKVSFTGSPGTGAAVLRIAAADLTPSLMELGGKNPLVVFDDANLHEALLAAVDGGFFNQGEACTAASRILVAGQHLCGVRGETVRCGDPAAGGRRRRSRHRRRPVGHPGAAAKGFGIPQDRRGRRRPHRRSSAASRRSPIGGRVLHCADRADRRYSKDVGRGTRSSVRW